jgi:Ca2+-binding EF-hand superfamily protein
MIHRISAAVMLGLLAAVVAADPQAPAPAGSTLAAVYFGPDGPVRMTFHVTIDGRPVDAIWAEAADALFNFCDTNGDGVLDSAERAVFAPPRRMRAMDMVSADAGSPLRLTFDTKEEGVSRPAFAAALRAAGYGPMSLKMVAGRPDSQQLSAALFRHLDRDGDGRLSPDELKAARERLTFLDVNEDELLSTAELLGRAVTANVRQPLDLGMAVEEPAGDSPDLVVLSADGGPAAKQVLAARGGARATFLRPAEFGASGPAFAALDKDGNGRLDAAELAEWLRQPADLEFSLTFGPGPARLTPVADAGRGDRYRAEAGGAVAANLAAIRFRFEPPAGSRDIERIAWTESSDRLRGEFRGLAGGTQVVRRNQLANQPGLSALFELANRHGADQVRSEEIDAALKALASLAGCRVTVTIFDRGGGLFELLDRNGDGQLSPRELVEAAATLTPFAGPDGKVGPTDLPRRLEFRSAVASVPVLPSPPASPRSAVAAAAPPNVPAWFTQMDRNGDGDVSLREFLGPIELFRKLDRNGDGLISPEEARVAGDLGKPR